MTFEGSPSPAGGGVQRIGFCAGRPADRGSLLAPGTQGKWFSGRLLPLMGRGPSQGAAGVVPLSILRAGAEGSRSHVRPQRPARLQPWEEQNNI